MPVADKFRVVLRPKLACESDAPWTVKYVEVVASRGGEADRRWRIEVENLGILIDIIEPADAVVNMICDLRDGTAVTLPGDYSAMNLVLLGFRMPFKFPHAFQEAPDEIKYSCESHSWIRRQFLAELLPPCFYQEILVSASADGHER
jgi:hypothetical protein